MFLSDIQLDTFSSQVQSSTFGLFQSSRGLAWNLQSLIKKDLIKDLIQPISYTIGDPFVIEGSDNSICTIR